ncbi:hypothetical protein [Mesorhizobium sp. M0998]|uniref:hypothetical protein n=1 Tax=Mesorhizobium sp. M0998 TaxID=2957044 RepID=UPI003336CB02
MAAAAAEEAQVPGLDNTICHSLKAFGNLLKRTGHVGFAAAMREVMPGDPLAEELMEAML